MNAVSKEDVARLSSYLVVPVAVTEALSNAAPLAGEDQYAMHVALSEIDPDSALLAIALSAFRIAQDYTGLVPVAAALKMEADKIIADYAPDWLAHYHNHPVQGDALYDLLTHVPEDLESLADLLESLQTSIADPQDPAHTLCAVLSIQARAHMEIADYVLTELEAEFNEELFGDEGRDTFAVETLYAPESYTDNIILFPVHRRR
ncbi:MAG: hypothetical protein WC989_06605 [Micavibrio sp.]